MSFVAHLRSTEASPESTLPSKLSTNLVRLTPLNRPTTNGLLSVIRHAYICGKCKRHKKFTNTFLHREGSPKKSVCQCEPSKKEVSQVLKVNFGPSMSSATAVVMSFILLAGTMDRSARISTTALSVLRSWILTATFALPVPEPRMSSLI